MGPLERTGWWKYLRHLSSDPRGNIQTGGAAPRGGPAPGSGDAGVAKRHGIPTEDILPAGGEAEEIGWVSIIP